MGRDLFVALDQIEATVAIEVERANVVEAVPLAARGAGDRARVSFGVGEPRVSAPQDQGRRLESGAVVQIRHQRAAAVDAARVACELRAGDGVDQAVTVDVRQGASHRRGRVVARAQEARSRHRDGVSDGRGHVPDDAFPARRAVPSDEAAVAATAPDPPVDRPTVEQIVLDEVHEAVTVDVEDAVVGRGPRAAGFPGVATRRHEALAARGAQLERRAHEHWVGLRAARRRR